MKNETYNGYKNRSTWLTVLHLDNTDKETWQLASEKAVQADTSKQYRNLMRDTVCNLKNLKKEEGMDYTKIDWDEVWSHFMYNL